MSDYVRNKVAEYRKAGKLPPSLSEAIEFAERVAPLPRCEHGHCLRDGSGDALEPPCGCRAR